VTSLPEDPTRPITEDDRDRAVQRLQDAYAQGHLPHEELDERLHRLLIARTHGELVSTLAPLPEEVAARPSTIAVAGGRIRRRGAWRVPRFLKVESAYGRVHLDLSRAVIEHPDRLEGHSLPDPAAHPPRRADDPDLRDHGVRTAEHPPRVALTARVLPGIAVTTGVTQPVGIPSRRASGTPSPGSWAAAHTRW
jgi:hypothetical protein